MSPLEVRFGIKWKNEKEKNRENICATRKPVAIKYTIRC